MAKRFGRTQRFKMRQQIDNLRESYELERGLLAHNRRELENVRHLYAELYENVKQAFGQNSALLPPQVRDMDLRSEQLRIPMYRRPEMSMYDVQPGSPCFMEQHVITLQQVDAAARCDINTMGHHVMIRLPNGDVTYFVTPDVMKMRGIPHEVRRNIVRCAMDVLNNHLMEFDGTKPRKE